MKVMLGMTIIFDSLNKGSGLPLPLFCRSIAHIYQKPDHLIFYSPIQCHAQPMGLVHVPAGKDAGLSLYQNRSVSQSATQWRTLSAVPLASSWKMS